MNQEQKIQLFKECIADYYGQNPNDICTNIKTRPIPLMRKILCFIIGTQLNMEATRIAKIVFPSGDHSNVYDALETLSRYVNENPEVKEALNTIISDITKKKTHAMQLSKL